MIILTAVTAYIVCIAILVVIEFGETCIQLAIENIQVHGIAVKDIFINCLLPVPTLGDSDIVSIGLLGLLALARDDIRLLPIAHVIGEAVIPAVHLLHKTPRPACMPLRILKDGLSFSTRGVIARVRGVDTIPVITLDDGIVISGRRITGKCLATRIKSVDVPTLCVILSLRLAEIIGHPRCKVVVAQLKESCDIVLAT